MKSCLLLLLFLIGLSSCARSVSVIPRKAEIVIPEEWVAPGTDPGRVKDRWWEGFDDDGLKAAIVEALEKNRDLRAAAARVEAAVTEAQIAKADQLPTVGFALNRTRQRINFIGFPFPGAEGRVPKATFGTLAASFDVSWEADLWGRIRSGEFSALALAQAEQAEWAAAHLSIASQTAKAWFACTEARRQIEVTQGTVESYQESIRWIRTRYEMGVRPALDLRLALSDLASAEALRSQYQEQYERQARQLEILLGRYPAGQLGGAARLPELPSGVPAGLPSQLLRRRPDLRAAEKRLLAAEAQLFQSRKSLYPQFSLTSSAGTSSRTLVDLVDGDFSVWSLIGNLIQPIFQGGRIRRGIELAEIRSIEAVETFVSSVLRAFAEVESALAAEKALDARLADLEEAALQAGAALELAQGRYRRGLGSVLAVLESERRVIASRSQILTVRRLRLDNRVNLYLALGGGLPEGKPGGPSLAEPKNGPAEEAQEG